jgi:hypothetical protein
MVENLLNFDAHGSTSILHDASISLLGLDHHVLQGPQIPNMFFVIMLQTLGDGT